MKTKNLIFQNNPILSNHIFKRIVLQAPTALELEQKVKDYELALVQVITSAYRLFDLSLGNKIVYDVSQTGCYQAILIINFFGRRKDKIMNPRETEQNLTKLKDLESKQPQEFHLIKSTGAQGTEALYHEKMVIEVEQDYRIDEIISIKQRELLERLISKTHLIKISFLAKSKHKEPSTGKTIIVLSVDYRCIETPKKSIQHTTLEEAQEK